MGAQEDWVKVRREWVKLNPPNHQEQYLCGICAKTVHKDEMELDHILPRSGSHQSFADLSNLQPSHARCNRLKGSRRLKPLVAKPEYDLRKLLDL